MEYAIVEFIIGIIDVVIHMFFLEKLLGCRERRKINRYILVGLYFFVGQYFMIWTTPYVLQRLCIAFMELVYCVATLNGKWREHIKWTVFLNLSDCVISYISLPVFTLFTGMLGEELMKQESIMRIWTIMIQKFIIWAILTLILFHKGKKLNLTQKEKQLVDVLVIANVFLISVFYVHAMNLTYNRQEYNGTIMFITLLIVAVLIICVALVIKISAKNKQMLESDMLRFQLANQSEMIESMKKSNDEVSMLRHDLKHYAVVVQGMLAEGDLDGAKAGLEKYMEKIVRSEKKAEYIKENPAINAVIYNSVCKCNSKEIPCSITIETHYPCDIEQDIAIALANMLDNAIRAEEELPKDKRNVTLKIYEKNDFIFALVSNYIEKSVLDANPELQTTKDDHKLHGWGIKSVNNILEKCNGAADVFEGNNSFNVVMKVVKK